MTPNDLKAFSGNHIRIALDEKDLNNAAQMQRDYLDSKPFVNGNPSLFVYLKHCAYVGSCRSSC